MAGCTKRRKDEGSELGSASNLIKWATGRWFSDRDLMYDCKVGANGKSANSRNLGEAAR